MGDFVRLLAVMSRRSTDKPDYHFLERIHSETASHLLAAVRRVISSEAVPNGFPTGTLPREEIVQSQNGGLIA